MRRLILCALLLPASASAAPPGPFRVPADQKCKNAGVQMVKGGPPRAERKRLNELPPATVYMAVHRTVDGCTAPMTMSEYRGTPRR